MWKLVCVFVMRFRFGVFLRLDFGKKFVGLVVWKLFSLVLKILKLFVVY